MGMCETLMLDVMVPEAHQNDCSYVRELSGLTAQEFSMVSSYMEELKNHKLSNGGLGACSGMGTCLGQYSIC